MIQAAGLLPYRTSNTATGYEVFLTHPGGPYWQHKDDWSIAKGELEVGETLVQALQREFIEETGIDPPLNKLVDLGTACAGIRNADKINYIWAAEMQIEIADFHCDSMVTMEWPKGSQKPITFPENDRAEWFDLQLAYAKVYQSQMVFIERLADILAVRIQPISEIKNSELF